MAEPPYANLIAMREMHEKMMNAKSPNERSNLMAEHMKAMRDGMAMMDDKKSMPPCGRPCPATWRRTIR